MSGVQFWRFPDEEEAFLEFLEKTGNIVGLSKGKFRHKDDFAFIPLEKLIKDFDPPAVYFCLDSYLKDVVAASCSDSQGEYHVLDLYKSPVISYVRGKFVSPRQLSTSLLSAHWSYSLDRETSAAKPEDFIKWAKKIFRWVQKTTPEFYQHKHCRITPHVAEAIRNNQVDLKSIGGGTF
jgi:hypothetical protein